jgi:hypothetical protein
MSSGAISKRKRLAATLKLREQGLFGITPQQTKGLKIWGTSPEQQQSTLQALFRDLESLPRTTQAHRAWPRFASNIKSHHKQKALEMRSRGLTGVTPRQLAALENAAIIAGPDDDDLYDVQKNDPASRQADKFGDNTIRAIGFEKREPDVLGERIPPPFGAPNPFLNFAGPPGFPLQLPDSAFLPTLAETRAIPDFMPSYSQLLLRVANAKRRRKTPYSSDVNKTMQAHMDKLVNTEIAARLDPLNPKKTKRLTPRDVEKQIRAEKFRLDHGNISSQRFRDYERAKERIESAKRIRSSQR